MIFKWTVANFSQDALSSEHNFVDDTAASMRVKNWIYEFKLTRDRKTSHITKKAITDYMVDKKFYWPYISKYDIQ